MKIIRGFSTVTGYSCSRCHHKCCATEYDLPLLSNEYQVLLENYPFCSIFLQSLSNSSRLIRGDGCSFLVANGLCLLHDTPYKPLICQTYPLVFWNIKRELLLTWIYPCRGDGFQWVADSRNQISNREINDLTEKIDQKFTKYWGEEIDKGNPFDNLPIRRIEEELEFFEKDNNTNLIARISKQVDNHHLSGLINSLEADTEHFGTSEDLNPVINSVLHWLCWTPVGLNLTFANAKLIFSIAATWINYQASKILSKNKHDLPLKRQRFHQQLGSFLAISIVPSFWEHVEISAKNEELRSFSRQVIRVLTGEIPQQHLGKKNEKSSLSKP
ncbi:MAG: YkgJ family cysteine cluster protein [Candidatus Hodarchaeales archaeon]|jgi:Fe-S-cluster containining protein